MTRKPFGKVPSDLIPPGSAGTTIWSRTRLTTNQIAIEITNDVKTLKMFLGPFGSPIPASIE